MLGWVLGLTAGGVLTSGVLLLGAGLFSWVAQPTVAYVLGSSVVVAGLRDVRLLRFPLPERKILVPKLVLQQAPASAAFRFGFELGLGFRTHLSTTLPYVLALGLVLAVDSWWTFPAAGLAFGLGRFTTVLQRYGSCDGEQWDALMARRSRFIERSASGFVAVLTGCLALSAGVI